MRRSGLTLALVAAGAILVAAAGGAVAKGGGGSQVPARFAKVDPALYASDGAAGKFTPAADKPDAQASAEQSK